jgi:hypothetical protein
MEEYELGLRETRCQVADLIQTGSRNEAIELSNSPKVVEAVHPLSDYKLLKHSAHTAQNPVRLCCFAAPSSRIK